ncbi:uncharacterized protein LOC128899358 [Dryobates pubescens]|uniref:uncharacterized protein LOC128899358 n=1 Tax=Dryobates pubescens TaxID=118200 RepID=UPI0023B9CFC0|nr:uncharacterized protein LOC128899358 [Dryobates pubescens]
MDYSGQLQPLVGSQKQSWMFFREYRARRLFSMFTECLQPSSRAEIILMAIAAMEPTSGYNVSVAAHMVSSLVVDSSFLPGTVRKIVSAIYRKLPSIKALVALKSLDRALLALMDQDPRAVVATLLHFSQRSSRYGPQQPLGLLSHWQWGPETILRDFGLATLHGVPADRALCPFRAASTMWNVVLSKPQTREKVLQELVRVMMDRSQRKTCIETDPRLFCMAAIKIVGKIVLQPTCQQEVKAIFPQLFLALLFQVSFTTELMPAEVLMWWDNQQEQCTPIRSAVQSMRVLLCSMGLESQVLAIQEQGGWDALLRAKTHLMGVRIVAREMMEMPTLLRSTFFCQLAEILSGKDPSCEMIAMVFFIETVECSDCEEELQRALKILAMYLQSQCLGMPSLVLRAILRLTQRPDTARKTLVLLPLVLERLRDDDGASSAAALPVLAAMLRLLEGRRLNLAALELADKLWPLFGNESDTVRELSIRLFRDAMRLVARQGKEKMKKVVCNSLLPLLFHLHDESKSVAQHQSPTGASSPDGPGQAALSPAKRGGTGSCAPTNGGGISAALQASQEALRSAGHFLNWRRLAQLAGTQQAWSIRERLLSKNRSRAKDYLHQSQSYLRNPQEALRLEAVRFIGLIGRLMDEREDMEHVREVLEDARTDDSPLVSSLLTQTILILGQRRAIKIVGKIVLQPACQQEWLLQEEPIDCLDTAVRQQAMLAMATMSRARLLQQDKYSILQACFKSVFSLPPQHSRGSAAFLYSKTLSAMDSMLQALVCSAGTLGGVELQNILKVLLPYTCSQLPEVQKRAMAQIARLLNFINNSSGLEICPCFAQRKILRHECPKIQKFGLLGKLVGQLTLSCTCKDKETSCEAAEALYELHIFVLQQTSKVEWMDYSGQLQPLVGSQKQSWMFFRENRARRLFSDPEPCHEDGGDKKEKKEEDTSEAFRSTLEALKTAFWQNFPPPPLNKFVLRDLEDPAV